MKSVQHTNFFQHFSFSRRRAKDFLPGRVPHDERGQRVLLLFHVATAGEPNASHKNSGRIIIHASVIVRQRAQW